jgi:hypothetical protein
VVHQLDLRRFVDAAIDDDALVVFRVGVGDSLPEIYRGAMYPIRWYAPQSSAGVDRSFDQDPMRAVRLLADIGLRALSPAVNEPRQAVNAVHATEGLLRALAVRELRVGDVVDDTGVLRVRLVLPTWEDYLRTGVEDLPPVAAPVPMVLRRIQRLLANLLDMSPAPRRDGAHPAQRASPRSARLSKATMPAENRNFHSTGSQR